MKIILSFLFSICCLITLGQTTSLSFTTIGTGSDDFLRPGGGANEWSYGQYIVQIPTAGVNSVAKDRYWRFTWLDFQPAGSAPNAYNFTVFDQKIQESISKGQGFSFGIMQECTGCDLNLQNNIGGTGKYSLLPTYLHTQMQGEANPDYLVGNFWLPAYSSPSYLTALRNINSNIYNHIMTTSFMGVRYQDVIDFIDIRGIGDFGEWTNNDFTGGAGTIPTAAQYDSIAAATFLRFPTFPCVALIAGFDGQQLMVNTNIPAATGYYLLTASNSWGRLGWRRDNWGQTDSYIRNWLDLNNTSFSGLTFKDSIMTRYRYSPVVGEPQDGGSAGDFPDLPTEVVRYGANSFGNGNFNNPINTTIQNNFRAASKLAGYRLTLVSAGSSMTTSPQTGSIYNVTINWSNVNGIPALFPNWRLIYEWRDGPIVLQRDTAAFLIKGFYTTATDNENFTLRTVPAGTHDLYLKVVDPTGYRTPMPLFITGRTADGAYPVRTGITVTAGSGVGVANAGPSQTITLPVSSVNLDGTLSSGTISSYAWTQLPGGPNTASLGTPSSVVTTASGLIAGVYVFQLQVNGLSTDTMRVYVNPATPPTPSATTIFTTQIPASGAINDGSALEVGLKFQSTVAGYITGIRFYKAVGNTGTHIGQLYDRTGTLLASATFTSETTSGWQTVQIAPAVPILANTTYITAYFSSAGFYSYSSNYLGANIVNSPLLALADGVDGHNGVYDYSGTPVFPTSYSTAGNRPWYGNDVVFSLTNPGTTPTHVGKKIIFIQNLNLR